MEKAQRHADGPRLAACFEKSPRAPAPTRRCGSAGACAATRIALVERENLLDAAYSYRIVPLDEPPSTVLQAGGEDAGRPAAAAGKRATDGAGLRRLHPRAGARAARRRALFAERRMSLALALDELGNELLFALSRRVQDRIVVEARKAQLTVAGELRAGDPGLPLAGTGRRAASGRRG